MTASEHAKRAAPGSQLRLADLLHEESTLVGLACRDAHQAIETLGELLKKQGYVEDGFVEDVLTREKTFPTGLPTDPFPVALPHADPDHVVRTGLALGILNAPVTFVEMGSDGSKTLDVQIVLMMAIKEQEKQVDLLRRIVQTLQSPDKLARMIAAETPAQAVRAFLDAA